MQNDVTTLCNEILDELQSFEQYGDLTVSKLYIKRDKDGKLTDVKAIVFGTSGQP